MIDRLEVRRRRQDGADVHVIVDIGPVDATFELSVNGHRTNRTAPRDGVAPIIARLDTARLPAVPLHPSGGEPIGYEITIIGGDDPIAIQVGCGDSRGLGADCGVGGRADCTGPGVRRQRMMSRRRGRGRRLAAWPNGTGQR